MTTAQQRAQYLIETQIPFLHSKAFHDAIARYLAAGHDIAQTANNWQLRYYGAALYHDDCA